VALNAGSYSVGESGPSVMHELLDGLQRTIGVGQTKTCTVTNNDIQPRLIVVKHVVKDNGGTAQSSDFAMSVTGTNPSPSAFRARTRLATAVQIDAGTYSVGETESPDYTASYSADCSGTIAIGETKVCTVTNDDTKASPR